MLLGQQATPTGAGPLAPPSAGMDDPTALLLEKALGERDRAMSDVSRADAEPEKIELWRRLVGGLADAAGAYSAGLQGRPAPESAVELLRRRREMAADRENERMQRDALVRMRSAEGDIQAAREDVRTAEQRKWQEQYGDKMYARGKKDADESYTRARRDAIEDRDARMAFDDEQTNKRLELAWAEYNAGRADAEQERLVKRDQDIRAAMYDDLDGLVDESGNPATITDAQYQFKLKTFERRLRVMGITPDSPEFRIYMREYQKELDPHWSEPRAPAGGPVLGSFDPTSPEFLGTAAGWLNTTPMRPGALALPAILDALAKTPRPGR